MRLKGNQLTLIRKPDIKTLTDIAFFLFKIFLNLQDFAETKEETIQIHIPWKGSTIFTRKRG